LNVLIFSGLDPCGGAGVVADIESINHFHATPLTIITALTVQNTASVETIQAVNSSLIKQQYQHLEQDSHFEIIKIGLLSSIAQIQLISELICKKTLVLDPIVSASTGKSFLNHNLINALKKNLLPKVKILTPNMAELFALTGEKEEKEAIKKLNCEWVLLTKTEISDTQITHCLYKDSILKATYSYQKLPHNYHGSGCTLSSSIAALLANNATVESACQDALDYTYQTFLKAKRIG
jgi:hydroxymethylpyrimidine/phosphomethylpyrimidine kinase